MVDDSPPTSHAWARDDAERIAIEQILGGLTGRRLNAVRYVERLGYPPPHEPYWSGPLFDWIDDAIELDLDDGVTWRIEWEDGVGDNAGVRAHPADALLGADEQTAVWEVTDHWRAAGPREIALVTPVWCRFSFKGTRTSWERIRIARGISIRGKPTTTRVQWTTDLCLVTLILTAEDGRQAVITRGERRDDGSFSGGNGICDLAVFFSVNAARAARVVLEESSC